MTGQPQPNPNSGNPLDKLSKDVAQYQKAQVAAKRTAQPAPAPQQPAAAPARPRPQPAPQPAAPAGLVELDRTLGSQMTAILLIGGYAMLMLGAGVAVMFFSPAAASLLWPVMAIGVIVSMVASHKGRPPLLWFMYGSVVPLAPLLAGVVVSKLTQAVSLAGQGGLDILGLSGAQGSLAAGQQSGSSSMVELFLCICVVGLIPVVHALLSEPDAATLEARQLAAGMKKCPACAEIIRPDARVCRYCGQGQRISSPV